MAKTHEICWPRLWWYRSFLPPAWSWTRLDPHAPTYSVACAYEIDEPFRASRSVVIRLAFTRGIIFHWWEVNPESLVEYNDGRWIERHLLRALNSTKGSKKFQDSVTVDEDEFDCEYGCMPMDHGIGLTDEPDHSPLCEDLDCPGNGGPQRAAVDQGTLWTRRGSVVSLGGQESDHSPDCTWQ